jgi:CBS domain-containing protein
VDPLEALAVEDVMRTNVTALPAESTISELDHALHHNKASRGQRLYPVVDGGNRLLGVVTRTDLKKFVQEREGWACDMCLKEIVAGEPVVAHTNEPLRLVVNRMAATGLTQFPVVKNGSERELLGMIGLRDLLKARELTVEEEHRKERVLRLRLPASLQRRRLATLDEACEQPTNDDRLESICGYQLIKPG